MKRFFVFIFLSSIIFGCAKQPANPAITDANITYRTDVQLNSATGDTVFAVFIPNAFSPNDDGINDDFGPKGVGISSENYLFSIYSSWNNKIFETKNFNVWWDGRRKGEVVMVGVYTYRISLQDIFGEKHSYSNRVLLFQ